jgi:hypothetical protein
MISFTERTRHYLYGVVAAIIALLMGYGILGAEEVPLWIALAVAVLGVGTNTLASRNTSKTPPPPPF